MRWIASAPTSGTGCTRARPKLEEFRGYLADLATELLSDGVALAVRLLSDYGDRAALFDTSAIAGRPGARGPGAPAAVLHRPARRRFVGRGARKSGRELRALRNTADDVQFELLVVSSVEDAITAVALNGEIQAAIIRHDLPLRSHRAVAADDAAAGHQERCRSPPTAPTTGSSAASGSGSCDRTSICICSPTNRSPRPTDEGPDIYDRTFYRLNDATDLHSTVLAGMRTRFATPFFDALRSFASSPVGQFHALPVARGASIFNSKSLQDMGEFYGRNIFMAETSSTSGGLDSLLDPHGNLKKAMDKAAKTWNSDQTYFVTNGTSTANKIVVQSLDPAGRHRADRPQLSQVAPLRPGAGRGEPAVPGRLPAGSRTRSTARCRCAPSSRPCSTSRRLASWTGCGCCC